MPTRGVIYYNKGTKCIIRLLVSIHSLRKHYSGPLTVISSGSESNALCKKISETDLKVDYKEVDLSFIPPGESTVFLETTLANTYTPYDTTIWIDSDTLIRGKIDELFDAADENGMAVTHFAEWSSSKGNIAKRTKFWTTWYPDLIQPALDAGPALNCGVLAFKKDTPFMLEWYKYTLPGRDSFIPNETCMQVIAPLFRPKVMPGKFNCSCKYGPVYDNDTRIIHFHGRKHVRVPKNGSDKIPYGGDLWIKELEEVTNKNLIGIKDLIPGDDKQLRQYLQWKSDPIKYHQPKKSRRQRWRPPKMDPVLDKRFTIVTCVTPNYLEKLKLTIPTWSKKKQFAESPLIVFHNGFQNEDDLKFVSQVWPNSKLIHWTMPKYDTIKELVISAFVFGAAAYVETPYTVKLDCDSFFLNNTDIFQEHMFGYDVVGHKWRYTKPGRWIVELDDWADINKLPGERYLKTKEQIEEAKASGRFGHKRYASWICLHKTSFLIEASAYAKNERLPIPSHDTYTWYICSRIPGKTWAWHNWKKLGCGTHTDINVAKERIQNSNQTLAV